MRCWVIWLLAALWYLRISDAQNITGLPLPTFKEPAPAAQNVPLKDFNLLLAFADLVQAGTGDIVLSQAGAEKAKVACNADINLLEMKTSRVLIRVIPTAADGLLEGGTEHKVKIPSTCFRNTLGEVMEENPPDWTFSTVTKGTSYLEHDKHTPRLMDSTSWTDSIISPLTGTWLKSNDKFVLYFTEAVQKGEAAVTITKEPHAGSSKVWETIDIGSAKTAKVEFDTAWPGKVIISPNAFESGAEYQLSIASGAFKDVAGNFLNMAGDTSLSGYTVRMKTTVAQYFPQHKAGSKNGPQVNVTRHTNLVFEFGHPIEKGTGTAYLCRDWTPTDACYTADSVTLDNVHFLGRKVIINPAAFLTSGAEYNVSIPNSMIKFYDGISANSKREWSYSFTVEKDSSWDTGKPDLVTGLVDCNGDKDFKDSCDADGDGTKDFVEMTSSVGDSTPMLTTAKFRLYFREAVRLLGKGTLQPDDGDAATKVTTNVGGGPTDCVVSLKPFLSTGKLYTLSLGSGVLTDNANLKNPYDGTAFSFYTPLSQPTPTPVDELTNVAKSTSLKLTFADTPRLGLDVSNLQLQITESSEPEPIIQTVRLTDPDVVRFEGLEMLIIPRNSFKAGKTYKVTLPKHSVRYMTTDFSFSFTTRAEDTMKPSSILSYPSGTIFKLAANGVAPYAFFSESITAVAGKKVIIKEDAISKYSIAVDDSTCGTANTTLSACVEIDSLGSRVTFYPLGKSPSGRASDWALAGKTYTVDIESSAFSDSVSTGVLSNFADASTFKFTVHADAEGPTIKGGLPLQAPINTTSQESVFLEFNENIQAGDFHLGVRSFDYRGTLAPSFLAPATVLYRNGHRMTITLAFDTAVQTGLGNIEMYSLNDDDLLGKRPVSEAIYVGSKVIFKPPGSLAEDVSYYIKTSIPEGVMSAGTSTGVPLGRALDTSGRPISLGNWTNDTVPGGPAFFIQVELTSTTTTTTTIFWDGITEVRTPTVTYKYPSNWYRSELFHYQKPIVTSKTYHSQIFDGKSSTKYKTVDSKFGPQVTEDGKLKKETKTYRTLKKLEPHVITAHTYYYNRELFATQINETANVSINETANVSGFREEDVNLTTTNISYETLYKTENVTTITEKNITDVDNATFNTTLVSYSTIYENITLNHSLNSSTTTWDNWTLNNTDKPAVDIDDPTNASFTAPAPVWSSLDEYLCLSADGVLPVVTLYMNEDIHLVNKERKVRLYSCGAGCDTYGDPDGDTLTWSLEAGASSGSTSIGVLADATRPFKVTIAQPAAGKSGAAGTAIAMGTSNQLFLEAGLFQDYDVKMRGIAGLIPSESRSKSLPFHVCEAKLDAYGSNLLRLYSPKPFATSSTGITQKFQVDIPPTAVKDLVGNQANVSAIYNFMHEVVAPTLVFSKLHPLDGAIIDYKEAIVLAFNEVIQSGSGEFEFWAKDQIGGSGTYQFGVDVGTIAGNSGNGHNLISGKKIAITPKTLAANGVDLGHVNYTMTYYVRTETEGVVRDAVGNPVEAFDTRGTWVFKTRDAGASDALKKPEISFVAGQTITGTAVTGYVHFTENIVAGTGGVTITDCGSDLVCSNDQSTTADESKDNAADITNAVLSYGDGGAQDGTREYGMLRYVKTVPTNNRKYRIKLPTNLVKDGAGNTGPSTGYSFYIDVGTMPTGGSGPSLPKREPASGASSVAVSSDLVLYFNEDVQQGSGTVHFCLNAGATFGTDGVTVSSCTAGKFSDGTDATFNAASAVVDRRQVKMDFTKDLKIGQTLYVLLPQGVAKDTNATSTPFAKEDTIKKPYFFTVTDQDTIKPKLDYLVTTSLTTGHVTLVFTEAVQDFGGANLTDANGGYINPLTETIEGNIVKISGQWTAGRKYKLNMESNAFLDLAGNSLDASTPIDTQEFTISSDQEIATTPVSPANGATNVDQGSLISITFSEVVQRGTGIVQIYSGTSLGTLLMESDVASLPVLQYTEKVDDGQVKPITALIANQATRLMPGVKYSLKVPKTAFIDTFGNKASADWDGSFTVTTLKDTAKPSLKVADFGGGAPNPAFTATKFIMYFTEAVQMGTTGSAYLDASDGGNFCQTGTLLCTGSSSVTCNSGCGFTAAGTKVQLTSFTIEGAKVTAQVPELETGRGYKLMMTADRFQDLSGNTLSQAVDGGTADTWFVIKTPGPSGDVTGPQHVTFTAASANELPTLDAFPSEKEMVPPGTIIKIKFNEMVQAGIGDISFRKKGGVAADDLKMPVSSCSFSASSFTCSPPSDLERHFEYSIAYSAAAIKDAGGNTAGNYLVHSTTVKANELRHAFTTIDLDYTAPKLAAAGGISFAGRRLVSQPFDPQTGAATVSKGTVIALSFSENVQAGTGDVQLYKGSELDKAIDVTVESSTYKLYYDGKSVYIDQQDLSPGSKYSIKTSLPGVFKDAAGNAFKKLDGEMSFTVVPNDIVYPVLHQSFPSSGEKESPPNTDITLYFSEAVQGASNRMITVTDGSKTNKIPADNSNPATGIVKISGSKATIDPFDDMGYSSTVTVSVDNGAFKDLFGNMFPGIPTGSYHFTTNSFDFTKIRANDNADFGFPAREGAVVYWTSPKTLMLYGGRRHGLGTNKAQKHYSGCFSDLYTSTTGETWVEVTPKSTRTDIPPPVVAYAPSGQDKNGCVWLLGGTCDKNNTNVIWRSCDGGAEWTPLEEPKTPIPGETWPSTFDGHSIAIVGGWQLVVVDSVRGHVWQALDAEATEFQKVYDNKAGPFEFVRREPILLSTSKSKLYLMGGHNCNDDICSNNKAFTDVWVSDNAGTTWMSQTANYLPSITSTYSRGIGRYVTSLLTHDDTIFLIGGHQPNTTQGLNSVYTSQEGVKDVSISNTTLVSYPKHGSSSLLRNGNVSMHFAETMVFGKTGSVRLVDLGSDNALGGTTGQADTDVMVTTTLKRQVLTMDPVKPLKAGRKYKVVVPDGSLEDTFGNQVKNFLPYDFVVNPDIAGPKIIDVFPSGSGVAPWTAFALTMDEMVVIGNGSLVLTAPLGTNYSIDIKSATIVGRKVYFPPNMSRILTAGQTYTITVPQGLLIDGALNKMLGVAAAGTFKVMSGSTSSTKDGYSGSEFPTIDLDVSAPANLSEKVPPTFISSWPPPGATDVPQKGVSLTLLFNEPVKFNATGVIKIRNATGHVVGTVNMSKPISKLALVANGTQIGIPDRFISKAVNESNYLGTYIVQVPMGVITDLAHNPAPEINTTFTCLSGDRDNSAPVVVMADPMNNATGVLGSIDKMTMWFNEDVEKTSLPGSITITHQSGNPNAVVALQSENVTVSGSKVTIVLPANSLNRWDDPGLYYFRLPAASLRDKRRGLEGGGVNHSGINGSHFSFQVVKADSGKPTIRFNEMVPTHEGSTASYQLPISQSLVLVFSEVVQASVGDLLLTPKYDSPGRRIFMKDDTQVVFDGSRVVVNPASDLMPGEAYDVKISTGAVEDIQGNAFAGLTQKYTFSIGAFIGFKLVMSDSFQDADNTGRRFGSGGAVDSANRIFVLGGMNASHASKKTDVLNDVWRLVTNRGINCASSYSPKTKCNEGGSNATVCRGSPPTLGAASSQLIIWRAPDSRGTKCLDDSGVSWGGVGEVISTKSDPCPCPMCITHPTGPYPKNMINSRYVVDYKNVSAALVTMPILCKKGYAPTGNFTCAVQTQYIGSWVTPYPQCAPASCDSWPAVVNGVASSCAAPQHGGTCAVKCNDGYRFAPEPSPQELKCAFGKMYTPICMKKAAVPVGIDDFKEIFIVKGELELDLGLPEGMTAEELSTDKAFQKSVKEALVAGLGGKVDPDSVLILSIEVDTGRRRLAEAEDSENIDSRRLASAKLKVLYMITVEDEGTLADVLGKLNDPEGAGFTETFTKTLEKQAAANGMKGFKVKALGVKPPQTEVKIIQISTTTGITFDQTTAAPNIGSGVSTSQRSGDSNTTAGPWNGSSGSGGTNVSSNRTASPKPESPPPELEGDSSIIAGGAAGGAVGVLLIVGAMAYMKKKRKKAKLHAERDPDAVVPFEAPQEDFPPEEDGSAPPGAGSGVTLDPVTPLNAHPKTKGQKVKACGAALGGILCMPCAKCASRRKHAQMDASDVGNAIADRVTEVIQS